VRERAKVMTFSKRTVTWPGSTRLRTQLPRGVQVDRIRRTFGLKCNFWLMRPIRMAIAAR